MIVSVIWSIEVGIYWQEKSFWSLGIVWIEQSFKFGFIWQPIVSVDMISVCVEWYSTIGWVVSMLLSV